MDFEPLFLSLQLALITSLILLLIGIPIAYKLAYSKTSAALFVETMLSLPLVLPPTVIGFYLLLAFSPQNAFGQFLHNVCSIQLVFTFAGLVVASVFYGLPFMIGPLIAGFRSLPLSYRETAASLGKSKIQTLFYVLLPNMRHSLITAFILTFAHTLGEFGVVLMIGGNIPGQTRVASLAIFDEVESMNYALANQYSLTMIVISFVLLLAVYWVNRKRRLL